MFKLRREQKILKVGDVRIGGQPGELPTVLIGSILCRGRERNRGSARCKKKLERLIDYQEEMSDRTGLPFMLDIFAESIMVFREYIGFISELTDAPFLINGPNISVRLEMADYCIEVGLLDRTVYNSISYEDTEEEVFTIGKSGLKAAIIQSFNPRNPSPEGMIKILRGETCEKGLIRKASKAGLEKLLVLTPGLEVPSIGYAVRTVYLAKKEFGMPVGTAAVGVVGGWKKARRFGRNAEKVCRAGAAALAQAMGADFVMYGSIANAKDVFPVCAMIDSIVAYTAKTLGLKPLTKDHPLYRIFQDTR